MGDKEDQFHKDVKLELSRFRTKTKPTLAEALALRLERKELEKQSDDERLKKIDLRLQKLSDHFQEEADSTSATLTKSLKNYKLEPKDPRGLAKWYADLVDKESGIDLGKDVKLWGDVSFDKKEFNLYVKGKF